MAVNNGKIPSVYPGQYAVIDNQGMGTPERYFDTSKERARLEFQHPDWSAAEREEELAARESFAWHMRYDKQFADSMPVWQNYLDSVNGQKQTEAWNAWLAKGTKVEDVLHVPAKVMATPEFQQGMRVVGGALETVSGVLLIVNPFVPVASQSLGVVLIGHGLDSIQAGVRSLYEGKNVQTYTYKAASGAAKELGASDETANTIGMVTDNLPGMLDLAHGGAQGLTALVRYGMKNGRSLGNVALTKGSKAQVRVLTLNEEQAKVLATAAKGERYSLSVFENSCFVAGTPLLTPDGEKVIEQFRPGDLVLSRSEYDVDGPLEAKVVEEVFVRAGLVLMLVVNGRVIRTTAEHPFYVLGKGWRCAKELRAGDWLVSHEGMPVVLEQVGEPDEVTTVYNLRVADYHTYFVGCQEWGFSVWAHNADCFEAFFDTATGYWRVRNARTKVVHPTLDLDGKAGKVAFRGPNAQARAERAAEGLTVQARVRETPLETLPPTTRPARSEPKKLAENLEREVGPRPQPTPSNPATYEAAHLVPVSPQLNRSPAVQRAVADAKAALDAAGIDGHAAINGFWTNHSTQLGTSTDKYFLELGRVMNEAKGRGGNAVQQALEDLLVRVKAGEFVK